MVDQEGGGSESKVYVVVVAWQGEGRGQGVVIAEKYGTIDNKYSTCSR